MATHARSHPLGNCSGPPHRPRRATQCAAVRRSLLLGSGAALLAGGMSGPSLAAAAELVTAAPAADVSRRLEQQLEQRVARFRLPNGMTFVVVQRPAAPVVSINTYCSVGAWVEEDGQTGARRAGAECIPARPARVLSQRRGSSPPLLP
jgi:hypothetical protein